MIYAKKKDAFTLMEIMIAIVIMGILATLAGPALMRKMKQVRMNTTLSTMASLKSALNDYREDTGHFPSYEEGELEALVKRPKTVKNWDGPYLEGKETIPQDKWGNDFIYNIGPKIKHKNIYKYYEIISEGDETDTKGEELHMGQ